MDSLSCVLGCGLLVDNRYRVSPKKLSFTKLSFWRFCFQLGRNTYDICDKSGNAQFGKTQFLETSCIIAYLDIITNYFA